MLRLDVLFAQRKFSENHCITREERVTKMNSYSSKRKRVVEQSMFPEAASGVYQGLGMSTLATPTTTGDFVEVEPPRKRVHIGTDKTVLQNTLVTRSVDRGVLGGATRLLSNEQTQQFINSTVIPQNRTITNAAAASSVCHWSQYKQDDRPTQRNFPANDSQQFIQIPATNYVQTQNLQYVQQSQQYMQQRQQYVQQSKQHVQQTQQNVQQSQQYVQPVVTPSGQSQQYMLPATAAMGNSFPQNNSVAQGQVIFQQTTSIPTSCNLQSGVQQYVQILSADGTSVQLVPIVQIVPQTGNAPKPKKARRKSKKLQPQGLPNGSEQPIAQLTNQYHLTSHVSQHTPQTSQLEQFRSWHLTPQTVPTYVKPAEARTRHETKSPKQTYTNVSQGQAEIPRNFCEQVDTVSNQLFNDQQREATVNKSKAQSSTKKAGGKKNMERAVVPPKTKKDHVDYPPYVHRIMRILNRAEQRSQAEKNLKEKDSAVSKQITKECDETIPEKCSQPTPLPISLDNTSTMGTHSEVIATECGERSSKKNSQPTTLNTDTTSQITATEGMGKFSEQRAEPRSGSQRVTEMCSSTPTPQKSSPVKASDCKQTTTDKCSNDDKINQTCNKKQRKESSVAKIFPVETHVSKVDLDKVLEELFPESSDVTLLEADSFYGPELVVTCGDYCFVAPFACC